MRITILFWCLIFLSASIAQTKTIKPKPTYCPEVPVITKNNDSIEVGVADYASPYVAMDDEIYSAAVIGLKQPQFEGGISKFYEFIEKNIIIPQEIIDTKGKGKVFVSFIIEKNGKLTGVKVLRDMGHGTKEEIERLITISPYWIPAIYEDKKVRCRYTIPITIDGTKK
jgi:hypothetical protein